MKRFKVHERGVFAGVWSGRNQLEALEQMANAHGYSSFESARSAEWQNFEFTIVQLGSAPVIVQETEKKLTHCGR